MATGILCRYEVHVLGLCGHLLGAIAMDRRWYPGLAVAKDSTEAVFWGVTVVLHLAWIGRYWDID